MIMAIRDWLYAQVAQHPQKTNLKALEHRQAHQNGKEAYPTKPSCGSASGTRAGRTLKCPQKGVACVTDGDYYCGWVLGGVFSRTKNPMAAP